MIDWVAIINNCYSGKSVKNTIQNMKLIEFIFLIIVIANYRFD